MADLAIWMVGHVSVPLQPSVTAATARRVLEDSEARFLFVGALGEHWRSVAPGIPEALPRIALPLAPAIASFSWDAVIARTPPLREAVPRRPDDLATLVYGSAGTGTPSAVPTSFGDMLAAARELGRILPMTADDRMLSYLPFAHAEARAMVEALSLGHGFRLFFAPGRETMEEDLRRARPTLAFALPRVFVKFHADVHGRAWPRRRDALLLRVPFAARSVQRRILRDFGLDQVRGAVTGPLPADVAAWYRRIGLALIEGSGFAEPFAFPATDRADEPVTAAA
jgi:long-subunit acyl-CoA synthetase (AMP-forming)